ncbi:MAG: hypothetical protein ACREMA_07940, partial [Longimicrobiales bacterium]
QQYSSWAGTGPGAIPAAFGFTAPGSGCWAYDISGAGASQITMRAQSVATGAPARCNPLGGLNAASIVLSLNGDGSSGRAQSLP